MSGKSAKRKTPWRDNLESILSAVVVALLFKSFALEVSQIPSGSMQPTLMGNPEAGVLDRVLVDKLSYHFRDPQRFEVVVFKHPLERSRDMVKRLIGMPGEQLKIENGDIFLRQADDQPWSILRRPPAVQREMLLELDPGPWRSGTNAVRPDENEVKVDAQRALEYQPKSGTISNLYLDGYDKALRTLIPVRNPYAGENAVADLRLEGELEFSPGCSGARVLLGEGSAVYCLELGAGGPSGAPSQLEVRLPDGTRQQHTWQTKGDGAAGGSLEFAFQNLDDQLQVEIEGEVVLTIEIPAQQNQRSSVRLESAGGAYLARELRLSRDIYYTSEHSQTRQLKIPEGHYFMMGDNSVDSADGREWQAIRFHWTEDGQELTARGNFRPTENPLYGRDAQNQALVFLRDEYGERRVFARASAQEERPLPAPTVPRELLRGRVFAVFWPLKPTLPLWRLSWVH